MKTLQNFCQPWISFHITFPKKPCVMKMCDVNGAACHPSSSYLCNISFQCHACSWAPADVVQSVPGLEMPFCSWWFLWQPTPAHGGRRPWPPVDGQQECVMNLLVFYFMQHAIRLIFPHICLRHSLNASIYSFGDFVDFTCPKEPFPISESIS